ncbi:MAG: LysR family transcriptional regulator [Lachnospiraceae bacterium]|nr:LysR family transcriptional regulator [Lachnospiraceae bacterium]
MNTSYLAYALEIERVGSITQAAQNLYMAQPNLSKALKELEKELGYPIFKRTALGVKATEEGEEFLFHAKHIMEQFEAMGRISQRTGGDKLRYKLSIPRGSYIVNGFTSFISELSMEKGMEITINETNDLGTISNVVDHNYNLGIIRYQVTNENYFLTMLKNNHLSYETIWEFEYVLVMSREHPLADKPVITIEDLEEYTKITHGDMALPHERYTGLKTSSSGNVIYVYERGSQFDLLANVPSTYMWVSPIPQKLLDKNQLIQRSCKTANNLYKDVMIFREDYHFSEYDRLFQKKLYESKVDVSTMKL